MDLLLELKKNPFVLAPMAGITDNPFRNFMGDMGCGIMITELVSAHGIEYKSAQTLRLMKFEDSQRPIGIQLFGETPEALAKASKVVEDLGADFVDLNCGCPVPKVVKKGAGSALLKDPVALRNILRAMKSAVSIPVTLKIRTGWDAGTRNADEVAQVAFDEGLTWVSIHGRTRAQAYTGEADWEYIRNVKQKSKIAIIGNGDIHTAQGALDRLERTGCDGVMIGRGCLKNPWIFQECRKLWVEKHPEFLDSRRPGNIPVDFFKVFSLLRSYLERECDERLTSIQLKKFASWFSAGYPGAAQFRKLLFTSQSYPELISSIESYFSALKSSAQADTSHEAFLQGGHG